MQRLRAKVSISRILCPRLSLRLVGLRADGYLPCADPIHCARDVWSLHRRIDHSLPPNGQFSSLPDSWVDPAKHSGSLFGYRADCSRLRVAAGDSNRKSIEAELGHPDFIHRLQLFDSSRRAAWRRIWLERLCSSPARGALRAVVRLRGPRRPLGWMASAFISDSRLDDFAVLDIYADPRRIVPNYRLRRECSTFCGNSRDSYARCIQYGGPISKRIV